MAVSTSSKPSGRIASIAELAVAAVTGAVTLPASGFDLDTFLIRRCRTGDTNAYRQLIERHERRVVSIISRIMAHQKVRGEGRHICDVEDIAQEVFVLAWRALPNFRGDAKFSTWLYRIATNRALKEWRRSKSAPGEGWIDILDEDVRMPSCTQGSECSDPEDLIQFRLRDERIMSAVDSLPEKQRIVILLHYYEEYSCEEIAQILTCSIGTVWSRLHYACKRLRGVVEVDGE